MRILVQEDDFDISHEIQLLTAGRRDIGAVVSFTGLVREFSTGPQHMFLEHYPGMTEQALKQIAKEADERWPLQGITIIHRVGALKPADQIVLVLTASPHRGAAFEAAQFIMDFLKSRAPFWKKEEGLEGGKWVDAREEDEAAIEAWSKS